MNSSPPLDANTEDGNKINQNPIQKPSMRVIAYHTKRSPENARGSHRLRSICTWGEWCFCPVVWSPHCSTPGVRSRWSPLRAANALIEFRMACYAIIDLKAN